MPVYRNDMNSTAFRPGTFRLALRPNAGAKDREHEPRYAGIARPILFHSASHRTASSAATSAFFK